MSYVSRPPKVLIMAGGTGGHIFPGLAVAHELITRGWQASWLGSMNGMEENIVAKNAIELNLIKVAGLRGNGLKGWFIAPFSLSKAVLQALKIMRMVKPTVVVGFGGFASGPGGIAAFLTRTPLVIHEQNAIAGMTNRWLAKLARKVFQGFPGAFDAIEKVETVGNPVRESIRILAKGSQTNLINERPINILVVGGSRGALALNKNVPKLLKDLINAGEVKVKHQVGKNRLQESIALYHAAGVANPEQFELCEFIDDMADAFQWADLLIARAGASTVAEVAAAGVCAVFVPFPFAVDDHQRANSEWLVKADAAVRIDENQLTSENAKEQLIRLIRSPQAIMRMAQNAKQVAYLNAAKIVADYCDTLRDQAA